LEMSILGSQEAGHCRNWEHRQNRAPNWAQSGLIGFGQVWLGASPKLGLESGLMEIAKITSPHHRQGAPLGQREKRKRNCSFHH
jgi:hypothetical protein